MQRAMSTLRFDSIAPAAPDLEALAGEAQVLCQEIERCSDPEVCIEALKRWDRRRRDVSSYSAWVSLKFQQNTQDSAAKAAREAWDRVAPRWTELEVQVKRQMLAHPRRGELESRLGAQAFALWQADALAFSPTIKQHLVEESRLEADYTELLAGAELPFRGATENLSTIVRFRQNRDRQVRSDAELALWTWFDEQRPTLDRIFEELVRLRTEMAHLLGLSDGVELGYQRMSRIDYTRADVEGFRAAIRAQVVPLAQRLVERQGEALRIKPVMAWDEFVHDPTGNPAPRGDRAWMVQQAQEMFDALEPELGSFFRSLDRGGFLDLDSRKGKAGGGFCTSFPSAGMPFVFANFNGTKGDVEVLTHEIGHAFQNYSSQQQPLLDYLWPTYESAEIHSMSLEFLTWPWMESFFGADAERFRRVHLTEALMFLPYGTAVDHFQHEVYSRPNLTNAQRHGVWREMEQLYLPWRNWGHMPHASLGGRWQHQRHIFLSPFYYIDYVLAQTCALQLWALAERDQKSALEAYVGLCQRGGSLPFQALVKSASLSSPFESGCLSAALAQAQRSLGL
jgi:M3 family oligoendopeptidase